MEDTYMERMMADIEAEVRMTRDYTGMASLDARVLEAMRSIPRHEFVPGKNRYIAYQNGPASIGCGQTISQPYIVALMTSLLQLQADDKVLEVGTGSGYQAAVLSKLCREVYSLEIIAELAESSRKRLQELEYNNITVRHGDGYYGWPEKQPFDAIIVTAAAHHVPEPLLAQLRPGGRMVIPVGSPGWAQELVLITKNKQGEIALNIILSVAFVPLTGEHHDQPYEPGKD